MAAAELLRFAWCGHTGQQFSDKCFILHISVVDMSKHSTPSTAGRTHPVNHPTSENDAFWRGTHFKIIIWAHHCSGFTVWIKFKQAHANTESPLTLFCAIEGVSWGNKSLKKRTRVNQIWAYREEKSKIFICKSDWNARYEIRCEQYLRTDRIWPSDGSLARRDLEDLKLSTIYSCEQLYASIKNQKCPETVCKAKYWDDTKQWKMLH